MKYILVVLGVLVLSACEPEATPASGFVKPPQLEHCTIYKMINEVGTTLYVMHCPNATTTTHQPGKYPKTSIVVDGIQYERKSAN